MLTQVNIKNFKSINDENLKLTPLTILTGTNSSGKSSVIQAIMLMIMNSTESNQFSMESLLRYVSEFKTIRNKRTNAKIIEISLHDKNNKIHSVVFSDDGIMKKSSELYYYEQAKYKQFPELLYLNANRLGAQDIVPSSNRRVGEQGEFLFSTFEKIKTEIAEESLIKFNDSKTISFQVAEWLSYITGTSSELKTEKVGDQVNIYFSIKDLEWDVSPFNLGAGMSYISKVIIICLMAKKGDLVILENPEVQLHPRAQAHLGEFLTFIANGGVQLIVETHCEHLLNKIAYQIFDDKFSNDDLIVHYKSNVESNFTTLLINENGSYTDSNGQPTSFPSGFFDATLNDLLSMR